MIDVETRALLERVGAEPRRIFFPFLLPGLNQLLDGQKRTVYIRDNPTSLYQVIRRKALDDLALFVKGYHRWPAAGPSLIVCNWREATAKRDPDNIVGGGRKLLLDALGPGRRGSKGWTGAGVMHCDGRHCVRGFFDIVTTAPPGQQGVEVIVAPVSGQLVLPLAGKRLDLREVA